MSDRAGEARAESAASGAEIPLDVTPLHSTNLLTVLDETGVVRYESPAIERIYGYDQDELVGEQVTDYFHPDDRERVLDAFRRLVSSKGYTVEAVEYRHRRADGTYCWVESVGSADPTPDGHYVINSREISERKERQRELARKNDRLEQFANVVGHDLRNPLNVATIELDGAIDDCDSPHLEGVATALDRMEGLIDDLLGLARAGKRVDELAPVPTSLVVEECWESVSTVDATLRVEIDRYVTADRSRLRQLFENLIRNAIEHGGDAVTVTVGELADGSGFYVADDGPGIPEDRRDQILETGFSTNLDGTGLGLAIVDEITTAHGWELAVTKSERGGSRFEFDGVTLG